MIELPEMRCSRAFHHSSVRRLPETSDWVDSDSRCLLPLPHLSETHYTTQIHTENEREEEHTRGSRRHAKERRAPAYLSDGHFPSLAIIVFDLLLVSSM